MNPATKITPPLQQIYYHRYQYQQHKNKLIKIYEHRKSHLGNSTRTDKLESLKDVKSKSFMDRFHHHYTQIQKENLKFLEKLENVRPSIHRSVSTERDRDNVTPFMKRRILQTEKQNERMSSKMKSMSSTLNKKKFVKDYAKSQQIKQRLMRYTAHQSRVYLKSDKYFGENDGNQSVLSHKSREKSFKQQSHPILSTKFKGIKSSMRAQAITHYKKQDIQKNRIDLRTNSLAGIKRDYNNGIKAKHKPDTSINNVENQHEIGFFSTQPYQNKKIGALRKYFAH